MKKHKMLITLAGLVVAVATTATVAAYTLAGDGSDAPVGESTGTEGPAFLDDKLPTDFGSGFGSSEDPPLHGDPTYETWLKDNPPTDDMTDTPPTFNPGPGQVGDDGSVFVDLPDTGGGAIGIPDPSGTWPKDNPPTDDMTDTPPLHGDPPPPVGRPQQEPVDGNAVPHIAPDIEPLEPGEVVTVRPPPTDDVEDLYDQLDRVDPSTGLLIDPLLATSAEVKVTGEVVSEGIFSVDGRVFEVYGETVQVMNYGDAAALEAEATRISPDGSSVGTTMVMWVGSPHFFRTESLIALYVGESASVLEALTKVMGPQFAGR